MGLALLLLCKCWPSCLPDMEFANSNLSSLAPTCEATTRERCHHPRPESKLSAPRPRNNATAVCPHPKTTPREHCHQTMASPNQSPTNDTLRTKPLSDTMTLSQRPSDTTPLSELPSNGHIPAQTHPFN